MKPIRKIIATVVLEIDAASGVEIELQDAVTAIRASIQAGLRATVSEVRAYPLATDEDVVHRLTLGNDLTHYEVDTEVERYTHRGHTIRIWQDPGNHEPRTFYATVARPGAAGEGAVMQSSHSANINQTKRAAEDRAERQTEAAAKRAAKTKTARK
jgi:hypothetical protein